MKGLIVPDVDKSILFDESINEEFIKDD